MRVRRLGWAGVELEASGESLVIDHVLGSSPLLADHLTLDHPVAPTRTPLGALVTHLHEDHTDVAAFERTLGPGGLVLRPAPVDGDAADTVLTEPRERALAASTLDHQVVAEWETRHVGPFAVTAVPAVDGLGDPQVSWVVEADGQRVLHGGDTIFHGFWWRIARRLGPIDAALLPVNGAVVDLPHLQPASTLPASMTPAGAVEAARLLGARVLVPIHFGIVWPGGYEEDADPLANVRRLAERAGQTVVVLAAGETFGLESVARSGSSR